MTKQAGTNRYARIALIVQMLLLGVIVGELYERDRAPDVRAPILHRPPAPPPIPTARLQTRLRDLNFKEMPLSEVLWNLAWWSGENLGADWQDLKEDAGILPTDPISLQMTSPTLASALDQICRQLHSKWPFSITYGESGGGILIVGPADSPNEVIVPNIASVFDVHDLLNAPAKLQPVPSVPWYELPKDIEARADLRELAGVLQTLQPQTWTVSFGTRLIVSGTAQASRRVKLALDAIRHPYPFVHDETDSHADSHPLRIITPRGIADPLVAYWRKLGGNQAKYRISGEASDSPGDPVIITVSGESSDDVRANSRNVLDFPVVYIAPGEENEFAYIRRVRLEDDPRAYNVNSILGDSKLWMNLFESSGRQAPVTTKDRFETLTEFIFESDHDPWSSDSAERSADNIAFWNGLLIVRQDPAVHRHIAKFLEHLQRTGRPFDPPPDQ